MIRIGIVGAENSHSAAIGRTVNIQKLVPGARVVAIWGETDEFAQKAAEAGQIPTIVRRPEQMLGMVDAVVVDHRHAKCHLPAAQAFLKARLPMFIDKPFCYRLAQGRRFLAYARRLGVPVTSYSSLPTQQSFADLKRRLAKAGEIRALTTAGPVDLESAWGGVFFYGIHQVDMIVDILGGDVRAVSVARGPQPRCIAVGDPRARHAKNAVAHLFYADGRVAVMHCLESGSAGFQVSATTDAGSVAARVEMDQNPYVNSTRTFVRMFKTGVEPLSHERILQPVAILEALEKAVKTGKLDVPVARTV